MSDDPRTPTWLRDDHRAPAPDEYLVGMGFDKATRADEVLLALVHLAQEGELDLADAVVVAKTDDGRVHVRQTVDVTPGKGALFGSWLGFLAGVIFALPLVGMAAGAGAGALAGKLVDRGLNDKWLKEVGGWLLPGTSALLLLVKDEMRSSVLQELGRWEGRVLYCDFPPSVADELARALKDAHAEAAAARDLGAPVAPPPVDGPADANPPDAGPPAVGPPDAGSSGADQEAGSGG